MTELTLQKWSSACGKNWGPPLKNNISWLGVSAQAFAVCLTLGFASSASAGVNEVRGGFYAHDIAGPAHEDDAVNINGEILFDSPDFLSWAFSPRPRLGATLNTNGDTSLAYLDLGWTIDLTDTLFLDFSVGGAVHDGELDSAARDENSYGCRANFHESISLGYRMSSAWSVMVTAEHMSNAWLCEPNDGITNVGARVAYSF